MTKPASKSRARVIAPAAGVVLALTAAASFSGCLVSFDGYQLANAGASGDATVGGQSSSGASGHESGGSGSAGKPNDEGGAPSSGASGASSGGATNGGSSMGGALGGNTMGGAGIGGSSMGGTHSGGAGAGGTGAGGAGMGGAAGGSAGTAGSAGTGGAPTHCPAGKTNRQSQQVPLPTGGGYYCIDYSEVRAGDYKAFLDANPGAPAQTGVCAFNTDYKPDVTATCNQYDPVNRPSQPVACVDWCDADAFCKWDGKHLCGKLGGGSNAPADSADATKSAWYRACSHNGDYYFPYGNTYNGDICIGVANTAVHPVSTPHTDCVGLGYDGLYDMSGNVAEWEDSCTGTTGATDLCLDRGGSYLDSSQPVGMSPSLQCNSGTLSTAQIASKSRATRDREIGFRCCSEPIP